MQKTAYGIRRIVALDYEEALARVREALVSEGFGVLTEIDMRAKLKEKLGADVQRYMILGACNPALALRSLEAEPDIGLLLPCNVIVYEQGSGSVIAAIDPDSMVTVTGNPLMAPIAAAVREKLERALAQC